MSWKINQLIHKKFSLSTYLLIIGVLFIFQGLILWLMGRIPMCECGYIQFWHGQVFSSGNSQHLSDWYTFSHIIHGFLFYWILYKISPKLPQGARMVIALMIEIIWEIIENSPYVINKYRETTVSLDYTGDSIINSISDSFFMLLGYLSAYKLPVWFVISLIIAMEIGVGYIIRDNLTLNVVMLIYPFEYIKNWQLNI